MTARRLVLVSTATAALGVGLLMATSASAEPPVTLEGVLVVAHEDDFEAQRSRHVYGLQTADGAMTTLRFSDDARAHELSGRQVRIEGERRGEAVEVTSAEDEGPAPTTAATSSDGPANVAVVMFGFTDKAFEPSVTQIHEQVFSSTVTPTVAKYYDEISYTRLPFGGTVIDAGVIDAQSTDQCNYTSWGEMARTKIELDETLYTHVAHVMPPSTCQFGGVAYLPGTYSWTITGPITTEDPLVMEQRERRFRGILSHELGHNVGAHHGGSWSCTTNGARVTIGKRCTLQEYGDPFTVMGTSWGERHFNGFQKHASSVYAPTVQRRSWFDPVDILDVTTTTTAIELSPLESEGGTEILRIPKPGSRSESYYVEFRDGSGFDAGTREYDHPLNGPMTNPAPTGVTVRLAPTEQTRAVTKLLDMTPTTTTFHDAAMAVGQSFTDGVLTITLDELETTRAVVSVTIAPATKGRK